MTVLGVALFLAHFTSHTRWLNNNKIALQQKSIVRNTTYTKRGFWYRSVFRWRRSLGPYLCSLYLHIRIACETQCDYISNGFSLMAIFIDHECSPCHHLVDMLSLKPMVNYVRLAPDFGEEGLKRSICISLVSRPARRSHAFFRAVSSVKGGTGSLIGSSSPLMLKGILKSASAITLCL